MRGGWWIGLAACLAPAACAPGPNDYFGSLQPGYQGYAQPGYVPPAYAEPGFLVPDAGPGYVPPYGYPAPVTPGFGLGYGYDRGREFREREFRDREFRRRDRPEFGDRERRFRDEQGPFNRGRFEGARNFERPHPPEPPHQPAHPPPPPLGQTPPLPGGIFPGVPRPQPR